MVFTEEETLGLSLGLLAARRLGLSGVAPAVEGALAKVGRVMPEALCERLRALERTATPSVAPPATPPDSEAVSDLTGAVGERRRVRLRHRSPSLKDSEARTWRLLTASRRAGWSEMIGAGSGIHAHLDGHFVVRHSIVRTIEAGVAVGSAMNAIMLVKFGISGLGWTRDGFLVDPRLQSEKPIAVWTRIEPPPLVVTDPALIGMGMILFGVGHAFIVGSPRCCRAASLPVERVLVV